MPITFLHIETGFGFPLIWTSRWNLPPHLDLRK